MKSTPIRKPENDILLAPGNAALILIDYQPPQVSSIESIDRRTLINNVVALAKTAKLFDLPIILTTVNVSNGVNEDTIPELADVLKGVKSIDRTSINSWEDQDFVDAVKATHIPRQRRGVVSAAVAGRVTLARFAVGESRSLLPFASGREVNRANAGGMLTLATKYFERGTGGSKLMA